MDPFELTYAHRRPPLVKSTAKPHDFDFEDSALFDRVLGIPNKIQIPERYIPETQSLDPAEEVKRSQKAAAICRILSKSSTGALLRLPTPPKPTPPVLPAFTKRSSGGLSLSGGGSTSGVSSGSSRLASVNGSLPASPVRRNVAKREVRRSAPPNPSRCDWSLAGVSVSHYCGEDVRDRGRGSDYYSSLGSLPSVPSKDWTNRRSFEERSRQPWNPSHSSQSSTSSSDREDLLHLQHSLAREVTEKSRIVAVRALSASPQDIPHRYSPLRPPTPPSPNSEPTIQQREGFFT